MECTVYLLVDENREKTYIGYSDNIGRRIKEHVKNKVKTTKNFGKFRCFKLEEVENIQIARIKEKYWKSHAGRKKIKKIFIKL